MCKTNSNMNEINCHFSWEWINMIQKRGTPPEAHTPAPEAHSRTWGTPLPHIAPREADSGGHWSEQYTSYWNAFLYHLHVLKPVQNMCFSLLAARALWAWMLLSCSSSDAKAVRMTWPQLRNPHCRTIFWVGGTVVYRPPTWFRCLVWVYPPSKHTHLWHKYSTWGFLVQNQNQNRNFSFSHSQKGETCYRNILCFKFVFETDRNLCFIWMAMVLIGVATLIPSQWQFSKCW